MSGDWERWEALMRSRDVAAYVLAEAVYRHGATPVSRPDLVDNYGAAAAALDAYYAEQGR